MPFVKPQLSFSYSRSPPALFNLRCVHQPASQIRLFLPSLPPGVSSPPSITFICRRGSDGLSLGELRVVGRIKAKTLKEIYILGHLFIFAVHVNDAHMVKG